MRLEAILIVAVLIVVGLSGLATSYKGNVFTGASVKGISEVTESPRYLLSTGKVSGAITLPQVSYSKTTAEDAVLLQQKRITYKGASIQTPASAALSSSSFVVSDGDTLAQIHMAMRSISSIRALPLYKQDDLVITEQEFAKYGLRFTKGRISTAWGKPISVTVSLPRGGSGHAKISHVKFLGK